MGVKGLLPFLKDISKSVSIPDIAGSTVGVDTYCWLHKAALICSEKIALCEDTDLYLNYCIKYLTLLQSSNVKIILVFDGKNLPAKEEVESQRRENRDFYMKKGTQLMLENKPAEAKACFDRCVNISHAIAAKLIKHAYTLGIKSIVAPYEADAQLAFLSRNGIIDYIITEDSDLLLFGAPRVIFKLDLNGKGTLIDSCDFNKVINVPLERYCFSKFRHMCIMSGCDYFPSGLRQVGLTKALQILRLANGLPLVDLLQRINTYRRGGARIVVTEEDVRAAVRAEETLLHQVVFDPRAGRQTPLSQYPPGTTPAEFAFAGTVEEDGEKACLLAAGARSPRTGREVPGVHAPTSVKDAASFFLYSGRRTINTQSKPNRSISLVPGPRASVAVKCALPWKGLSDSLEDINLLTPGAIQGALESPETAAGTPPKEDEEDRGADILRAAVASDRPPPRPESSRAANPFVRSRIVHNKRFTFKNPPLVATGDKIDDDEVKENDDPKRPRIDEIMDCSLSAKKVVARTKLFHIFRK